MSTVLSFAEESCWDGETFRSIRRQITFRLELQNPDLQFEFKSDFGVFFDPEDDWLIIQLLDAYPAMEWGRFVYWKAVDHSSIRIIDPDDDSQVGIIRVRAVQNPVIPHDRLPEGVVSLTRWRRNLERTGTQEDCTDGC